MAADQVKWPLTMENSEQRIRPHNPKVTGSNPVPATEKPGQKHFLARLLPFSVGFYRFFYRPGPVEDDRRCGGCVVGFTIVS